METVNQTDRDMKKIIHLSDLHLGYENLEERFRDMLARLVFHKTPAEDYVVVITGDLVENGSDPMQFDKARFYIDHLTENGFPVLVVPGNHDYGPGSLGNPANVGKFKKAFFGDAEITYPKLDIIENMAFIGLDSMAEELHWYDRLFAEGELGDAQLRRLQDFLNHDSVNKCAATIVYLHHHPFHPLMFHQLKDSDKFREVLADHRIDALLFGHNHEGQIWNGGWGISRAYDGGTSTAKDGKPCPHRIINFDQSPAFDYDARF